MASEDATQPEGDGQGSWGEIDLSTSTMTGAMRNYGRIAALLIVAGCSAGCTSMQLRTSTVRQAQTLTATQYQQVLDNLAMFCVEPNALPSLVTLKSGSTQIGDTGQLGFLGIAGIDTKFGASPTIAGSRSIVDQWGTAPVTDDNILRVLRKGYQNAIGRVCWLTEKEANDLGHDLSQQIGTNADISTNLEMLKALTNIHIDSTQPSIRPPRNPGVSGGSSDFLPLDGTYHSVTDKISSDLIMLDRQLVDTLDDDFLVYEANPHPDRPIAFPRFEIVGKAHDRTADPAVRRQEADELESLRKALQDEGLDKKYGVSRIDALPSTGLAKETKRQVNDIQDELQAIANLPPRWFQVGCKKPKDACYVGHYEACGREVYVWVCPDGLPALADFTLSILRLSTAFKDAQVVTVPSGIQYSPAFSRPLGGR